MLITEKAKLSSISPIRITWVVSGLLILADSSAQTDESARVLEEITVTAQRREQSLREVPISVEIVSGEEIALQGFRDMTQLASFSPTLNISPDVQNQTIMVRGIGTQGSNFSFEQAVPTFVDGVNFGRASQIKSAFLDIERIEVLRGPQPVYFGQNATGGALSLTTRKPGNEWDGRVVTEYGSNNSRMLEFGIGGPLSDTFGVRFAGKWDADDGHMIDVLSRDSFPFKEVISGRVILTWSPSSAVNVTFKYEQSDISTGGRPWHQHLSGKGTPDSRDGDSVLVTGLDGVNLLPLSNDFDNVGVHKGPLYVAIPPDNPVFDSRGRPSSFNMLLLADTLRIGKRVGTEAGEDLEPWNSYLEISYDLSDAVTLTSLTAFSHLSRSYMRHFDSGGPFLMNPLTRFEDFDQFSQELRFSSDEGGAFEWIAGVYYQDNNLNTGSDSWENNAERQLRANRASDDAEWTSVFGTITFNFFDGRASLDVGGRYTDVSKNGYAQFMVGQWILEDPVTGEPVSIPRASAPDEFLPGPDVNIIGFTDLVDSGAPREDSFSDTQFDPQVVFRFRPTEYISLYARYAEAFKAGGFSVGVTGLGPTDDFTFDSEFATAWEVGAKATILDGRGNIDISAFTSTFEDLQLSSFDFVADRNRIVNAAEQRVRGVEFRSAFLVGEAISLGFSGALLDGEMVSFPGASCTEAEEANGLCTGPGDTIDRSGEEAIRTPDWNFVLDFDYSTPVLNGYKVSINSKLSYSDGYILDDNFDKSITMDTHSDLNLNIGFGDQNDTWRVSIYGRNLTEPLPTYNPQEDINSNGLVGINLPSNMFRSYGVQFRYNYR
jgi:outer membrane receptor protein involved in Fe transport